METLPYNAGVVPSVSLFSPPHHQRTKRSRMETSAFRIHANLESKLAGIIVLISCCLFAASNAPLFVDAFSTSSLHRQLNPFRSTPTVLRSDRIHQVTNNVYDATCTSVSWRQLPTPTRLQAQIPNGENNNDDGSRTNGKNPQINDDTTSTTAIVNGVKDFANIKPQVVPQRWVQLTYLSLLALLSDWVCFSVAAAPSTFETNFDHSAASIIDIFLFTNVATSFLVTDVVAKFGLQRAIQGAAVFMMAGCWLRAGVGFIPAMAGTDGNVLMDYSWVVAGTVLVGIAQPFFQCTPPLLSAKWFANNERSTSTAIALNFNQIGIATAFLIGGAMAGSTSGLENYFGLIACMTTLVTIGTLLQFQNEPPFPPSSSELEKLIKGEEEPPFLESVQKFFTTKGFTRPLAAFICSISITNVVGAFIDEVMERGGVTGQFQIDLAGAGFELAIVAGGIVLGGYVDRTKEYKKVTMACLAATALLVLPLGLTDHYLGREPFLVILALLGLGMAAGPVQPINAELAVDVTYPGDETAVESVQQIGGNLVSALLIPLAEKASEHDYTLLRGVPGLESDIRGDVVLLIALALLTLSFFSGFDAPLARTAADESDCENGEKSLVKPDVQVPEMARTGSLP